MHHAPESRPRNIRSGFTLIELMISIGILGTVLALMAESLVSASSSTTTLKLVADLQSDAAYQLDRIAKELRGAQLTTPPGPNTSPLTNITFKPIPPFTSDLQDQDILPFLFDTAPLITFSGPVSTSVPAADLKLTRDSNGMTTYISNLATRFPDNSALGVPVPAGTDLPGFLIVRTHVKSLRLFLALSGTDSAGQTITRYAMREVPTNN